MYKQAVQILNTEPELRTDFEIDVLCAFFGEIAFFKGLKEENVRMCFNRIGIDHFSKGEAVCNFGEIGSTFHIVIKGRLGVKVPTPVDQEMTLIAFKKFVEDNRSDIISEHPHNPSTIARVESIGLTEAETEVPH